MSAYVKRIKYLKEFQSLSNNTVKFQAPLILKMYGALNKVNMRKENRYILCNFLDQHSDLLNIENIYDSNNEISLNQLLLFTLIKAKEYNLLNVLYDEYLNSINAINSKKVL
ncbi:MAG: hypothetical protein ACFFG0_16200 [Candidatus Thorarchaeota archaeon]